MVGCRWAWVAALAVAVAGCTTGVSAPSEGPASAPASQAATPTAPPSVDPIVTPAPSEASGVPAEPTGVTFDGTSVERADGNYEFTYTVTWQTPRSEALEIRVYGVTECLEEPTPWPEGDGSGPCVVEGAPMPTSLLELVAAIPAPDGAASWTWIAESGGCDLVDPVAYGPDGRAYWAVVLGAYSPSRHSVLAIADPGYWQAYPDDPNVMIC